MCGIAGIYAYRDAADTIDRAELRRIRDYMRARGPDGFGEWLTQDGRMGFGHRRLSIIELSDRGAQPMQSADGKLVVTFNGEIYNYRALRSELEAEGYAFRTQSDTEVLLHLYVAKGIKMINHLRGMFAFGMWDLEKGRLVLARDPYGIKPLYYSDDGRTLRFASQVKALLAGGSVSRDPEPAGWVAFLLFGSVLEPFTTFREIKALPAGTTLCIDSQGLHAPSRHFAISEAFSAAEQDAIPVDDHDLDDCVRRALSDSVRHHMVSDVPVGAFLSAGVDSGTLVGLMRDVGQQDIRTVTLAYEDYRGTHKDEAPLAAKVATHYGTEHVTRVVPEQEFRDDLPKIFAAMDQPTIDGVNTWFVSKAARELGLKAVISGLGGDEIFGGYPSFDDIPRWVRLCAVPSRIPLLDDAFRYFSAGLAPFSSRINPKVTGALKYGGTYAGAYFLRRALFLPWELHSVMDKNLMEEGLRRLHPIRYIAAALQPEPRSSFGKVAALEASIYMRNQLLRDTDWASMAHSLEVRVPLVDVQLLRKLAPIVSRLRRGAGKRLLAKSPSSALPGEIVDRSKTGFGTPINEWLQRDERLQRWRRIPQLAAPSCPWARRWAYQLATA
jgi:asparagine synthase (glutamine-hydrolysing)